jgi:hypothetical protein
MSFQMAKCDTCGNDYDKAFQVVMGSRSMTFDSFECAIHKLAPRCGHCQCPIIGHGVEAAERMFCCVHCAAEEGIHDLRDRQ